VSRGEGNGGAAGNFRCGGVGEREGEARRPSWRVVLGLDVVREWFFGVVLVMG